MEATLNETKYLSWIYSFQFEKKLKITPKLLKDKSRTKPSSVTEMIQKLAHKNYIIYRPYKDVEITDEGKHIALKNLRINRMWQTFMCKSLELNWSQLSDFNYEIPESSESLISFIESKMEYPRLNPFGEYIPNHQLKIIPQEKLNLSDIKPKEHFRIIGLETTDEKILKELDELGMIPFANGKILTVDVFDKSITLKLNNEKKILNYETANYILVKKLSNPLTFF